jgi:hypothetical protein
MTIRLALQTGCLTSALALAAAGAGAEGMSFNRVASFATPLNMAAGEDTARESSAEILSASDDGMTLVYTDSPLGVIGLIDIADPAAPKPLGTVDMGGEPTTAVFLGANVAAAVNTSESFTVPSGVLRIVNPATKEVVTSCDLGGQPDSVAKAPDGSFLAIAIENERDEDRNDGALPQMPAGFVVKLPVAGDTVDCAQMQKIELTGLAAVAPEDPEPEFVAVSPAGEIVVTLQENNHIAVIGADGSVASHFSAGEAPVETTDVKRDGRLDFTGSKGAVPREPDGVRWIDADHFVTANEGDYEGGSRGFTVWRKDGSVVSENGTGFERAIAAIGHYPEHRSGSKGVETESVEAATFGGTPMIFAVSERASIVGVYDATDPANPVLAQLLPSGVSPEGIVAIPGRNLLVTANEVDLGEDGLARAHVMIYAWGEGPAAYPTLTSEGTDPLVGWGALSALAATETPGLLVAASDSVYAMMPRLYTIDATQTPARITGAIDITRGGEAAQKLDIEGVTADGEGGYWLASEGRTDRLIPHALYHVDGEGAITKEIALPPELLASETRFGFEGIARVGDTLWMAVQREWGDDPEGQVKLVAYNTESEEWGAVRYPLEAPAGGWVGLSEIVAHGDFVYVIERDNLVGDAAALKAIYRIPAAEMAAAPLGGELPVVSKELVRDLLPDLRAQHGFVLDKVEGLTVDAAGNFYIVTDNDGVDDHSGETFLLNLGDLTAGG